MIKIIYKRLGYVQVEEVEVIVGHQPVNLTVALDLARIKIMNGAEWAHIVNV